MLLTAQKLTAPFPYFGGKRAVAPIVWQALGDVKHFIEPFFGSGAVLLARPDYRPGEHIETVCDKDGFVSNAWRALQYAPDEVARWCDWPVNHVDLSARKRRLIANEARLLENLIANDEWFDAKLAGYWIWAACCWIGSGLTRPGQIPHISKRGVGVHALGQRPHVSHGGSGVHAPGKIPHLSDGGKGVHMLGQRPHLSDGGKGVQEPYNPNLYTWFRALSARLRHVRVVCGDRTRVCGGNWQDKIGVCGIFFDPPYGHDTGRDNDLYQHESADVAQDVSAWALARADNPRYRIVIAGYYEEHEQLLGKGWTAQRWSTGGGYGHTSRNANTRGNANRHREALFLSPHCLRGAPQAADADFLEARGPYA